jgi:hypothetical protein
VSVQTIPPAFELTVPLPCPETVTESANVWTGGAAKDAVTDRSAVIPTTHWPVPLQAPPQPANVDPPVGVAESCTFVPCA